MLEQDEIEREFTRTLEAVRGTDARFVYDREGRPGAIAAIRGALPAIERELDRKSVV